MFNCGLIKMNRRKTIGYCITLIALLLTGCGRDSDDPVTYVADDDAQMNAAIAHARSTVGDFVARSRNPLPTDEAFGVKKMIADGNGAEHFWLTDISYTDGVFTGLIGNEPQVVQGLKLGQSVQVKSTEITDWMYIDKGKMVGNFTLRVLLERMPEEEAQALRKQFQMEN